GFALALNLPGNPPIARWDGLRWSALDTEFINTGGWISTMIAPPPGPSAPTLVLGGTFDSMGRVVSMGIAEFLFQPEVFSDGFESGDTSRWTVTAP
ncbi:MAG: hypothetical protein AAGM22_08460, partial [Acidobacteriota bacterium]